MGRVKKEGGCNLYLAKLVDCKSKKPHGQNNFIRLHCVRKLLQNHVRVKANKKHNHHAVDVKARRRGERIRIGNGRSGGYEEGLTGKKENVQKKYHKVYIKAKMLKRTIELIV